MFCIYCGKQIENTSHFCQYCGMSIIPSPASTQHSNQKQNSITPAIIALILSMIGMAITSIISNIGAFLGVPASIASVILCSRQIKNTHTKPIFLTGLCVSATGIILGIAIIACNIISSNVQ